MQWTFFFCILISSCIIAASIPDESRHKRSLSFLTSLFFHDIRRTQGRCTKTSQCKPSKEKHTSAFSDRQKNDVLPVSEKGRDEIKRKQTRTKVPKGARNDGSSSLTKSANDPYQAVSEGQIQSNSYLNQERPKNIQNLCDTNTPKNLNIAQNICGTSIIYAYQQPNSETVQTFTLDHNSGFILPENVNQLPLPPYVDDGMENIIWSVPPYPQQLFPSFTSQQYEESIMSPYVLLDHQQGNFGMNMLPNNHIPMYTGKPIIVFEDTSEKIKTPKSLQDSEGNKDRGRKSKQNTRGDIPD